MFDTVATVWNRFIACNSNEHARNLEDLRSETGKDQLNVFRKRLLPILVGRVKLWQLTKSSEYL